MQMQTISNNDVYAARHEEFKAFVSLNVEPFAGQWDREQKIPEAVIAKLAKCGYFGCSLPAEFAGQGWDTRTFGLLHEAFGRGSPALADALSVQAMVSMALLKWGTPEQKRRWLPPFARGETIAAFALTEPGTGSDLNSVVTEFRHTSGGFILNGAKKWISCGQFAGLFLVFGRSEQGP